MKILAINGSPRNNGSTAAAIDVLAGRMNKEHQFQRIDLGSMRISHCSGCKECKETGECTIKDDMTGLYRKIRESDMIVLASPIYFGAETGLFKNFQDRMYAIIPFERPNAGPSKASIILTCGAPDGAMKYGNVAIRLMSTLRYMGITDTSSVILPETSCNEHGLRSYLEEMDFQMM